MFVNRKFGLNNGFKGMSALGQKQTRAVQTATSALPLKADIVDRLEKSASCHGQTFTVIQSTSLGKR